KFTIEPLTKNRSESVMRDSFSFTDHGSRITSQTSRVARVFHTFVEALHSTFNSFKKHYLNCIGSPVKHFIERFPVPFWNLRKHETRKIRNRMIRFDANSYLWEIPGAQSLDDRLQTLLPAG